MIRFATNTMTRTEAKSPVHALDARDTKVSHSLWTGGQSAENRRPSKNCEADRSQRRGNQALEAQRKRESRNFARKPTSAMRVALFDEIPDDRFRDDRGS